VIQALEAQLSASVERKALAEEKLKANQERVNQLVAELPSELGRVIQEQINRERLSTLKLASVPLFSLGYYIAVMNLAGRVLQIQSLAFERLERGELSQLEYSLRAAAEYFRDSILFLYRERRAALERCRDLVMSSAASQFPHS
jgi:hypothetical protein